MKFCTLSRASRIIVLGASRFSSWAVLCRSFAERGHRLINPNGAPFERVTLLFQEEFLGGLLTEDSSFHPLSLSKQVPVPSG